MIDVPEKTSRYLSVPALGKATCKGCGVEFSFRKWGGDTKTRAFCTAQCYRTGRMARTWTERVCRQCNKPFKVRTCYTGRSEDAGRYCTVACQRLGRRQGLPREATIFNCEKCGKTFTRTPHHLERGTPRHCSKACQSTQETRQCATCAAGFVVVASSPQRYCSRECYRKSSAETTLEATVRRELEDAGVPFKQEVQLGDFVIDFVVADTIAVEVDGSYWHDQERMQRSDERKTASIAAAGFTLVRIDVQDMSIESKLAVNRAILKAIAGMIWPKPLN